MSAPDDVARLRAALFEAGYTVDGCLEALGPLAYAALSRGELVPARRETRGGSAVETLIRLFLLQETVPEKDAAHSLPLGEALAGHLVTRDGDEVRALVDIRPYGEADVDWWLVSDLGAGLVGGARERQMRPDYVLGVGGASTTLAQLTVRQPVDRALDLGTGCGVQALHLSRHCRQVVATDRNPRAIEFARLTGALSLGGASAEALDLREGDLFAPVEGDRFDLIVSNPPFVVSPESAYSGGRFVYRDSGLPGDEICRRVVSDAARHLSDGGWCQVLANWLHVTGDDWRERIAGWLAPTGCDAWVVQRELQDPAEYAELWLRDSGDHGTSREQLAEYVARYDAWLDYFEQTQVEAIGFGWITLHASGSATPFMRLEEITHSVEQPIGPQVKDWFARQDVLRDSEDEALLDVRLALREDVRFEQVARPAYGESGWLPDSQRVRQEGGLRRSGEIDAVGIAVLGQFGQVPAESGRTLREVIAGVAGQYGVDAGQLAEGAIEAVRGLIEDGFLTIVV
jgi:methylase of polypeptide subunit release factors